MSHPLGIWPESLLDPGKARQEKPRKSGITMVIDKGLGTKELNELLITAGDYIDYIKLGFGTCVLYPETVLREKIMLAKQMGVIIYPGGTLLEVAVANDLIQDTLNSLKQVGFDLIEISDGTITMSPPFRIQLIKFAKDMGFQVITEYGKKATGSRIDLNQLEKAVYSDLEAGANYVIVEGRESGTNVGIFDQEGKFEIEPLYNFIIQNGLTHTLIWEAPLKNQQTEFIRTFGANVNLGNIPSNEVIALEALRRGLRSDTFLPKSVRKEIANEG